MISKVGSGIRESGVGGRESVVGSRESVVGGPLVFTMLESYHTVYVGTESNVIVIITVALRSTISYPV
jgi:hypothetical protein